MTGMGRIVPSTNADALAEALISVLNAPTSFRGDPIAIAKRYSPKTIAGEYEQIFEQLVKASGEEDNKRERTSNARICG
jgi:glycosyltransferase involved in cell wall biosynthesis